MEISATDFAQLTGLGVMEDSTVIRVHLEGAWQWVELLRVHESGELMDIRKLYSVDSPEAIPAYGFEVPTKSTRIADRHFLIPGKVYRRQCSLCKKAYKVPIYHNHLSEVVGQVWSEAHNRFIVFKGAVCLHHMEDSRWQSLRVISD